MKQGRGGEVRGRGGKSRVRKRRRVEENGGQNGRRGGETE